MCPHHGLADADAEVLQAKYRDWYRHAPIGSRKLEDFATDTDVGLNTSRSRLREHVQKCLDDRRSLRKFLLNL